MKVQLTTDPLEKVAQLQAQVNANDVKLTVISAAA